MLKATPTDPVIYLPARRWTRNRVDVPIRIILQKAGNSRIINGRGKEISEGGMAVFVGEEIAMGEKIQVEFTPPYGHPIRVNGIVRNRLGYRYGMEFLFVNEQEEANVKKLRAFLRSAAGLEK